MSFFNEENQKRAENIFSQYPDKRSCALPLLHLAQSQEGYLSNETIKKVAQMCEIEPSEMMDTASFYTMFFRKQMGKYRIQVCQTLSCSLVGADKIVDHFAKKLKIQPGETTSDGKFSLLKVECLGACGTGPVIQLNDDYIEGKTIEELDSIVEDLK